MRENVVTDGLKIGDLLNTLNNMVSSGAAHNETIIVIDSFDGYRHGIEEVINENGKTITITTKLHDELLKDLYNPYISG